MLHLCRADVLNKKTCNVENWRGKDQRQNKLAVNTWAVMHPKTIKETQATTFKVLLLKLVGEKLNLITESKVDLVYETFKEKNSCDPLQVQIINATDGPKNTKLQGSIGSDVTTGSVGSLIKLCNKNEKTSAVPMN